MSNLISKNPTCRDVIAIAEPARDGQHLVIRGQPRLLQKSIEMHHFRPPACRLESKRRFLVAVRARGTQDKNSRLHGPIVTNSIDYWSPSRRLSRSLIFRRADSSFRSRSSTWS